MPELDNDSTIIVSEKGSLTLVYEKGFYSVWKTEGTFYHIYLKGKKIQRCFNLDIAIKMIELVQLDYKIYMEDREKSEQSEDDSANYNVIKAVEKSYLKKNTKIDDLEKKYNRLKKHFDEIMMHYRKMKTLYKENNVLFKTSSENEKKMQKLIESKKKALVNIKEKETNLMQKIACLNKLSRSVLILKQNEEKNYKVEEHKANLYSLAEEIRKIYFPKKETECQTT